MAILTEKKNEKRIFLKDSSIDYLDFTIQKGKWWTSETYYGLSRKEWGLAESLTTKDKVNIACISYGYELYITEIEKDKRDDGGNRDIVIPSTPNELIKKYGNPSLFRLRKKVLQEA